MNTDSNPVLTALLNRRSCSAIELNEPGPTPAEIELLLRAAHRVPDHGKIGPWRFIVFQGKARLQAGSIFRDRYATLNPDASEKLLQFEEQRFSRSPLVIAVLSTPVEHPKVPQWEQELSAGAACQNLLHAAHALGYRAQWLTEWPAYDAVVLEKLGVLANQKIAGFIYIGSNTDAPSERPRPSLEERTVFFE